MNILELLREASSKLIGKHLLAIAAVLVYFVISGLPAAFDERFSAISFLLSAPLALGISSFFLDLVRGKEVKIEQIFDGFKHYVPSLVLTILLTLAIGVGLVFLIVPGVIIALGFSMSYYIMADNPEMDAVSTMKASWEMMKGFKGDYFVYCLMSIGLCILGLLVVFIGIFYVLPIIYAASALFYEKLRLKN
jgi:uncharacterized membrane protein